jgi:hypothetical protein
MRPTSLATCILTVATLAIAPLQARAAAADAEPKGQIELLIRGSDLRPVSDTDVRVTEGGFLPPGGAPTAVTAWTNREGLVRFPWPAGVSRLKVTIPGVGYGRTGLVEILPDRTSPAPLAPLVPLAVLEGTVPADVIGPGTVVELHRDFGSLPDPRVPTGEGGKFRAEVPAGRWSIVAVRDSRRVSESKGVLVTPGQQSTGLALEPLPGDKGRPPWLSGLSAGQLQTVNSVNGTVRDRSGRPIAGARVWAFVFRDNLDFDSVTEDIKPTTADRSGRFEIKIDPAADPNVVSLAAYAPGRPPSLARLPAADDAANR